MESSSFQNANSKNIIIFIMGTSAVGKTKLSLALADRLKHCEIVNCDSMQIYKDANIMTAKATMEEQMKIKHHLLDLLDISVNNFTRPNFIEVGTNKNDSLFKSGVIPIVVGGTHYYLEGLLFRDDEIFQEQEEEFGEIENINEITTLEDYNLLKKIDPVMANKIHPNDKRKIRNYLNLYNKHKVLPSDLIKKCEFEKALRYDNSIVLWPFMQKPEVLREKARLRIEDMVNDEGITEIITIYENFCSEIQNIDELETKLDFSRGILQAIGYKEFFPFYKEVKKILLKMDLSFSKVLKNEKETADFLKYIEKDNDVKDILTQCKERLLAKTIKYTKKQLVWIENRLVSLPALKNRIFKFEFDSYATDQFEKNVLLPACNILENYKNNIDLNALENLYGSFVAEKGVKNQLKRTALKEWKKFYCDICDHEFNGTKEWETHLVSKRHTKKKQKIERMQKEKKYSYSVGEETKQFHCNICNHEFKGLKEWETHLGSKKHMKRKLKSEQMQKKQIESNYLKEEIKEEEKSNSLKEEIKEEEK